MNNPYNNKELKIIKLSNYCVIMYFFWWSTPQNQYPVTPNLLIVSLTSRRFCLASSSAMSPLNDRL